MHYTYYGALTMRVMSICMSLPVTLALGSDLVCRFPQILGVKLCVPSPSSSPPPPPSWCVSVCRSLSSVVNDKLDTLSLVHKGWSIRDD